MSSPHALRTRIALFLVSTPVLLAAASLGEGNFQLRVIDASGKPVVGALVVLSSPSQIGGARSAHSDTEGLVRFVRLTPGEFTVKVSAPKLQSATLPQVLVRVDQTTSAKVALREVAGATVEVSASVRLVDATSITAGIQFSQEDLAGLPVGRDQLSTIALAAAALGIARLNPAWMQRDVSQYVVGTVYILNVYWAIFNLLPIFPMDGGKAVLCVLAFMMRERRALLCTAILSLAVCGAAALFFIAGRRAPQVDFLILFYLLFTFISQNVQIIRDQWPRR